LKCWVAMLAPQFAASFIGSREANNLSSRLAIWAGEFRHPIAMSFDVNPDRISDVIRERIQAGSSGSRVAQESCRVSAAKFNKPEPGFRAALLVCL
jgi:hypothetical protein